MTGVVGGVLEGDDLSSLADELYTEPWYRTDQRVCDPVGLALVDHGEKDPGANLVWEADDAVGAVYGVVANAERLPWDTGELFQRVLDDPAETLPRLEGPFTLLVADDERVVAATDKAGSRPCYFATDPLFRVSTELTPLLAGISDASVDPRAVSDLLCFGSVVGGKTLLSEVSTVPPASYVEWDGDEATVDRYWRPSFDRSTEGYVDRWLGEYRRSMDDVVETVEGDLSLWLSGGIDSRVAAAILRENGRSRSFSTLTYDTGQRKEREIAADVAGRLGVSNRTVNGADVEGTIEGIQRAVETNDAMQSWAFVPALSFMFQDLADETDVVMEGGTFLGEDVWQYYAEADVAPVQTLYEKRHVLSQDTVEGLVAPDVDPLASLRRVVDQAGVAGHGNRSLDGMRRMYGFLHMRSNVVQRSQVGTRVVSDGQFLEHVLNMPKQYRMNTVPFTRGKLPYGVPRIKLDVVRRLNSGLEAVPYQRTMLPPSMPFWLHVAGTYATTARERFSSDGSGPYEQILQRDDRMYRFLDDLLADAAQRPYLDARAVGELRQNLRDAGYGTFVALAGLTGLELWVQEHLD